MASSSGNSSGTATSNATTTTEKLRRTSSSEEVVMDERKRKRMESNRESARRSRMRKQKLLDDLNVQVTDLKRENNQILDAVTVTTKQCLNIEAENSVLRAQMAELSHRLDSLNEILNCINSSSTSSSSGGYVGGGDSFVSNNHWNLDWMMMNQPIMASSVDYHHDFGY